MLISFRAAVFWPIASVTCLLGFDTSLPMVVLFNEGGDVVETELEVHGLGALGVLVLGGLEEAGLLLLLGLGLVLTEELEELGRLVFVNSVGELVDGWWDLESV